MPAGISGFDGGFVCVGGEVGGALVDVGGALVDVGRATVAVARGTVFVGAPVGGGGADLLTENVTVRSRVPSTETSTR